MPSIPAGFEIKGPENIASRGKPLVQEGYSTTTNLESVITDKVPLVEDDKRSM